MHPVDFSEFINSTGWHIVVSTEDGMYRCVSQRGHSLPSAFTQRKFAEQALYWYLKGLEAKKYKNKNDD